MNASYVSAALRRRVQERAGGRCEYCLLSAADAYFSHEPDHIVAIKHGGESVLENIAWACFDCNRYKGSDISSKDPFSGELVRLFHIRIDLWHAHFAYENGIIHPLTSIGRVNARLLQFNQADRVEVRRLLEDLNRYPAKPPMDE